MMNPIAIPMEDPIIHTVSHPYCDDPTCPCMAEFDEAYETSEQDETGTHPPDCACSWCEPQERARLEFPTDDVPWLNEDW